MMNSTTRHHGGSRHDAPIPGDPAGTIRLERVTIRRGDAEVLRDISLTIAPGSVTAIVGRSGVGKSSLVGVLNGLIRPASGAISVAGVGSLEDSLSLREHRRRTATIFQDHALIDRLSAIDNVLLGLADARHPLSPLPWPTAMRRRAAQSLEQLGLLHRAGARASQLSGGERQRVGVARALVREPSLLLGDEPFSSVDPTLVSHLSERFRDAVARTGLAIVIVLHQIEIARALADRIIGLANGGIAFDGTADEFDEDAHSRIFHTASGSEKTFLRVN